ncbi:rhamnan synthesis F family protein [Aminobacter sp. UC22_36]|uniref:rhamnan synthesis F family protein n=1 Tax=Aminobacter sp. UC22_36 TaxID=3374549 RepID=UPI003757491D
MTDAFKVAIVIHAFYMDVFDEILDLVQSLPARHKLFVTTVAERAPEVALRLDASGRDHELYVFDNRGRDVLPFLCVFPALRAEGFELVVKVHTKKSLHRADGDAWRRAMVSALLQPQQLQRAAQAFGEDPALGIVGPDGHLLSVKSYMGGNEARVLAIGQRLGLSRQDVLDAGFCAGSMFMARSNVIAPLVDLGFKAADFEPEAGQIDGTLAHALERSLALGAVVLKRRLASSADPFGPASFNDGYEFARRPPAGRLKSAFRRILG